MVLFIQILVTAQLEHCTHLILETVVSHMTLPK